MIPMTKVEGAPDNRDLHEGMAYFANTGPYCTTCGGCAHRIRKGGQCSMFRKLMGKLGPTVKKDWASCKYFERKK